MVKVGVIGNGRLGSVIIEALEKGLAPDCELIGVSSRSSGVSVQNLIDSGAEYIIEAASQQVLREYMILILEHGISVIPLSAGVLEDETFRQSVEKTARINGAKVILPHGAIGGLDLAATYALCTGMKGTIIQASGNGKKNAPKGNLPEEFHGSVTEAFALNPLHLNCVIEAGIACGGAHQTFYERCNAENGYWMVKLENDYSVAEICIEGKPVENARPLMMIALSAISALNRATSVITF